MKRSTLQTTDFTHTEKRPRVLDMYYLDEPMNVLSVNILAIAVFDAKNQPHIIYVPNCTLPPHTYGDHVAAKANSST